MNEVDALEAWATRFSGATRFSDALLQPLREVGALLAKEIDRIDAELRDLRDALADQGISTDRI